MESREIRGRFIIKKKKNNSLDILFETTSHKPLLVSAIKRNAIEGIEARTELRLDGDRKSGEEEDRRQPIPFDLARDRK